MWWFTASIDREHTFEGLVRFFEAAGGIPQVGRTDRMGALGTSQGKRFKLHPPTIDFARHHGVEMVACQARDAKRKGKCERPFRTLKESLLCELDALGPPTAVEELNDRAGRWLAERVHARPHSTTGEPPADRLETERRFLGPLARRRFDTAYVEPRRVHPRFPLVEWDSVPYSVPPEMVGHKVICRVEVDAAVLEVSWGNDGGGPPPAATGATEPVWDPGHRAAAEAIALGRRSDLHLVPPPPEPAVPSPAGRLDLGGGDYDIDPVDLDARYGCGCTGEATA